MPPTDQMERLTAAVAALAGKAIPSGSGAMGMPPMRDFTLLCEEMFPQAMGINQSVSRHNEAGRFALINLLRSTGLPGDTGVATSEAIAAAIADAMSAQSWARVHLCPLDLAPDLPNLNFGPCTIRQFNRRELEELIQWPRLRRHFPNLGLDAAGLAQFHWLVVREEMPVTRSAGSRGFPWLDFRMDRDFGAIDPHPRTWPEIVELAVFGLMLLPWETMVHGPEGEWRGFRIPWVYTVNHDPFTSPSKPRGPESLSREPQFFFNQETGEEDEVEIPLRMDLNDDADDYWGRLTDAWWDRLGLVLGSPIVNPLVAHFMVRAFRSDDIDEFLGQMVAIEAAIGMQRDYDASARPRIPGPSQSATARMALRAAVMTGDHNAETEYRDLFQLRSAFVHGRPVGSISSTRRIAARELARKIVNGLLAAAETGAHTDRTEYLSTLCG